MRRGLPIAVALLVGLAASPASAAELVDTGVAVPRAADSSCIGSLRPDGDGVARRTLTAPADGYLTARLHGVDGDWDLAVYRQGDASEPVAASAYRGAREVAAGFVTAGDELVVQACRRSGRGANAGLSVELEEIAVGDEPETLSLVRVSAPTHARKNDLARLGLDLTEHGGPGFVDVVVHGEDDRVALRDAGFTYKIVVADLVAEEARNRAIDERRAPSLARVLPSGRTATYRTLAEYSQELKTLANANPSLVRQITLPHLTRRGLPVEGLEITTNPTARDGKPVFLVLGLHHAREWPSGEHTIEWAYDLVKNYNAGDARTRDLMGRVRTIVVPVVNPDGFNFSRVAGQTNGHAGGFDGFDASNAEFHRKNCPAGNCTVNQGVDINRNYGDLWGGPGSTSVTTAETYRGPAPFSEPDSQNIRQLISGRQVQTMITNHTFGDEVIRQPGVQSEPLTPDEGIYKALGDAMAAENGYASIYSWQCCGDHVGTTDGWSYYTTGGLGYVFEIGAASFHPPFAQTVAAYDGSGIAGGGNREAYYLALAHTANAAHHGVLRGGAPPGAILRLTKSFQNRTSIPNLTTAESFNTTMEVPANGQFTWHVNQSHRPLHPSERWTLTCENPEGVVHSTQTLAIARGQALDVDVGRCETPAAPGPDPGPGSVGPSVSLPDQLEQPSVFARMAASFDGRVYRVKVKGSLRDTDDRDGLSAATGANRCAGRVTIKLTAKRRRMASGRADVDADCGFERTFNLKRSKLHRSLRTRRGLTSLQAVAVFGGGPYLLAAQDDASARVKKRRR